MTPWIWYGSLGAGSIDSINSRAKLLVDNLRRPMGPVRSHNWTNNDAIRVFACAEFPGLGLNTQAQSRNHRPERHCVCE